MTVTVRTVAPSDFDSLSALYAQLRPSYRDRPMDLSSDRFDALLQHPGVTVFGVFDGDRLVASCVLHVLPRLVGPKASHALIEDLVTQPGEHNKGHLRRLIQAAGAAAVEAGCERVMLMAGRSRHGTHVRELRLKAIRQPALGARGSLTFRPR